MTKTLLQTAALVAGSLCVNAALAQNNFPLKCRGPVHYAVGTGQQTMVVFINKHTTNAGNGGISLRPGTCAWNDRAISNNEPDKIYVKPVTAGKTQPAFVAFTSCAGDSRCIVEFLAHNTNTASDPHFRVDDQYVRVYYPIFP